MEGGIFMNKSEQIELQVLQDFQFGRKSRAEAAMLLGVSERSVSRRVKKIRDKGLSGIKHGNYGRTPINKLSDEDRSRVMALIKEKYFDFNLCHAMELLNKHHNVDVSYSTLRNWCRCENIGKRKKRRSSKARIYRERVANEGTLLQMDGSHHKWNGKEDWCLISLIDDSTSRIPVGQFYDGETSWNVMKILKRLFETQGLPTFLYTDGAGWAGGGAKRQNFSQVVRACEELGIKIIRAQSAQAKGRIERSYRTIQDRLIPEMRLNKITTMKDANRYLDQVFWPDWNNRYTYEPKESISRYRPLAPHEDLDQILCMKFERKVMTNHTISFENKRYMISPGHHRSLYKKQVVIHQYEDLTLKIFYANQELEFREIKLPQRRWI